MTKTPLFFLHFSIPHLHKTPMKDAPTRVAANNGSKYPKHQRASKNLNSEGKKSAKKLLSARDKAIPEKKQKTKELLSGKKMRKKKLAKKSGELEERRTTAPSPHSKGKRKEI